MFDLSSVVSLDQPVHFSPRPVITRDPGVQLTHQDLANFDALISAVPEWDGAADAPPPAFSILGDLYGIDLADLAARDDFTGQAGKIAWFELPRARAAAAEPQLPAALGLVGVGDSSDDLRTSGAITARRIAGRGRVLAAGFADLTAARLAAFTEGYILGAYHQPKFSAGPAPKAPAEEFVFSLPDAEPHPVIQARIAAAATCLVRDLAAIPANFKNPVWFADVAQALCEPLGLQIEIMGDDQLAQMGCGGLLAVSAASEHPARLVRITYPGSAAAKTDPAGAAAGDTALPKPGAGEESTPKRHVAIVGKGITFDTGGLSLKPREAMVGMKTDMAGAAVALATVLGAAYLELPTAVTAYLALAENQLGAASYRPGDVVTVYGGTRVEIANTDAEGRMVLADALGVALAENEVDAIIDVATLTGAATLGLGRQHGAMFATSDLLAQQLVSSGAASGEAVWRLPLAQTYRDALDSQVADIRHVTQDGTVGAGAITAALFLREFVTDVPWAHLDIAGAGRAQADSALSPAGPTGFGARLLLDYLAGL